MKKFSWILALIIALTTAFVFVGCPAADDDDTPPPKGNPTPVEPPYTPDTNAPEKTFTFASGGATVVGADDAEITYANGGFTYQYGSAGYQKAVVRFKVDLGTFHLGDYGGISFKWTGISGDVGLSPSGADHTKNIFILASDDSAKLTGLSSDSAIKEVIVNTDWYDSPRTGNAAELWYGIAGVPAVKGTTPPAAVDVATKFVKNKTLTGEIWIGFYLHSSGGSYSISDVKLVPAASFVEVLPPPPVVDPVEPPVDPDEIPADWQQFDLDLSAAVTATSTTLVTGGNATSTFTAGKLTSSFTTDGMRLVFPLTAEQIAGVKTASDGIIVKIEGTVKTDGDPSGNLFRYSLAGKDLGGDWASSSLVANSKLEDILFKKLTYPNQNSTPDSFIIQHRNGNAVTLEITKVTIAYDGTAPAEPAHITGIAVTTNPVKDVYQKDVTHFDPEGLFITVSYSDSTTEVVEYAHDAGFEFSMTAGGGTVPLIPSTTTFSANGVTTITVTYMGQSATFTVTVQEEAPPEIISIAVKAGTPTKTVYRKDVEKFDVAGLIIVATYDKDLPETGRTRELPYNETFTFKNGSDVVDEDTTFAANATITVTAFGHDATFNITITTLTGIAVKANTPTKLSYYTGDKFAPAGLMLTATWSDSSTSEVAYAAAAFAFKDGSNDIDLDVYTFAAAGTKTLTVTYKTLTAIFDVTVVELGTPTLAGVAITGVAGVTNTTVKVAVSGDPATVGGGLVAVTNGYKFNCTKGYGNSNALFSVDLGSKTLGDYEKVTIKFTGNTGDFGSKNVFLLAANAEADVTMWKSDDTIKGLVVNTTYFETNPTAQLYSGSAGVAATGSVAAGTEQSFDLPVTRLTSLTGTVWFSIYTHGNPNSVTITDITFVEPEEEE